MPLKLWRLGTILGISINRKQLGLEIDFKILNKEIEQKYNRGINAITKTFIDYCQYISFEDEKYLQRSYDGIIKLGNKLNEKDRKKFLNSPWMTIVMQALEKNNEL